VLLLSNKSRSGALLFLLCGLMLHAGPVDFGMTEVNAAIAARNLKWKVKYELTLDPPETYRIEPYAYGGAHITGGDLRGLMYGLLEAADQIRATGRLKPTHAVPATPVRSVRMLARAGDLDRPESYWQWYFQTLARDRFDHLTLVFLEPPANLEKLRAMCQIASEYALDLTLGLREPEPAMLSKILSASPLIRSVQIRGEVVDAGVYTVLREAGRRVALDPLGSAAIEKSAREAGVALRETLQCWPPCFELDPPREFADHALFYWLWGRVAYDPKTKAPDGQSAEEFRAAAQVTVLLAAAQQADPRMTIWPESNPAAGASEPRPHDFIASIPEAVHNRLERIASAKRTPLENADLLLAAADALDKSPVPDYQLLARLARYHAHRERAVYLVELFRQSKDAASLEHAGQELKNAQAYFDIHDVRLPDAPPGEVPAQELPPLPKALTRPTFVHVAVRTAPSDQPVTLTLQIGAAKDARSVRLHYRASDSANSPAVLEKPAAPSVSFSIPASDLPAGGQLLYYFEILSRENGGWFEPDPVIGPPYHSIRIEIK
jgi:hypothetical protein